MEPTDLYGMSIKELWRKLLEVMEREDEETGKSVKQLEKDAYDRVKFGYAIKVSIYHIMDEHYEEYPEHNRVLVKGYGKYNYIDFKEEIDRRETEMRRIITEYEDDDTTTRPREG